MAFANGDGRTAVAERRVARRAAAVLVGVLLSVASPLVTSPLAGAQQAVPTPTLELLPYDVGIHGHPMWDPWFDLDAFGYEANEYLVSGTATDADGGEADFTTRMVVVHPSDPADFAGTVMLDWVNVTAQFENAVNSLTSVEYLLREGWAWVHVSAQAAGICCTPGLTPQTYDPVRYADLSHPGDAFANAIFGQVAQSFKQPGEVHPLEGMTAEVVIAAGQSQGGSRLSNYLATFATPDGPIDAVLQQAGGSKTYEVAPPIPVIHLLGDREGTPEEPVAWPTYRLWEVAGAAHQDSWVGRQQTEGASTRLAGAGRQSRAMAEALWESAGNYGEQVDPREAVCVVNGALFPNRYAANAALFQLDRWVREGVPAAQPPRYEFAGDALAKDADNNTLGGLRYPPIDVPVATYLADSCNLGGITLPFTEAQLIQRYGDHDSYYEAMLQATTGVVDAGYLLVEDASDLLTRACNAANRFGALPDLDACTVEFAPPTPAPADPGPGPGPAPDEPDPAPLPVTGWGAGLAATALLGGALAVRGRRR